MLPLATFMQRVGCQPYANQRVCMPDWCGASTSRVTFTTTRFLSAFPPMFARWCIKQSDNGAPCMDALAQRVSSSVLWISRKSVDLFL